MSNVLTPTAVQRFYDNNGKPLVNGLVFTYQAGTTTKATTYKDQTTGNPNANPIVLDARGECDLWIPPNVAYKYTIAPAGDTDPPSNAIDSIDNVLHAELTTLYGGVDTGAINGYVLTFTANFSSYVDGSVIYWIPAHTNTGPSTLNINGIGIANITYADGSTLVGGELIAGQVAQVLVKSGAFILISVAVQSGSFVPAWSGFSVPPNGTVFWSKVGNIVTLAWGTNGTGTSNATSMSFNNLPGNLRPSTSTTTRVPCIVTDNGAEALGAISFEIPAGTVKFWKGSAPPSLTGFTNPGTKGMGFGSSLTYLLI